MSGTARERLTVIRDGEEIEVFNHVTVTEQHYVNSVNGYESFAGPIDAGDGSIGSPEAVTERVATLVRDEFGIDVEDHGIDVIDVESAEVDVV